MSAIVETRAATKTSKRKVPSYLIKEWVYDIPFYYKGYTCNTLRFLTKTISIPGLIRPQNDTVDHRSGP